MIKRNSTDAALIAMLLEDIYNCKKQFAIQANIVKHAC